MRAYVLARKGYLLTSPEVMAMSPAQWVFEYVALREKEYDDAHTLKNILVNVMGLNILRPQDSHGKPKLASEMTKEELDSFMPLVMWAGREDMVAKIAEQMALEKSIDESNADAEYAALVDAIDLADGDMDPILGPVPETVTTKQSVYEDQLKILVQDYKTAANDIYVDADVDT